MDAAYRWVSAGADYTMHGRNNLSENIYTEKELSYRKVFIPDGIDVVDKIDREAIKKRQSQLF